MSTTPTAPSAPSSTTSRSLTLPSGPVLVAIAYVICVLGLIAIFVGQILFTDVDPHANEGPIASIVAIGIFGTVALVIGLGVSLTLHRAPQRAGVGAVVLGVLSVLSLVFFWSGAPGILGACAAWLGGLTRGSSPQTGAARVAGIVGAFVMLLDVVLALGGGLLGAITGS
jgi:hypothetical protein